MRCSFNYYYIIILFIFIFLYMYTKLWQYCIIYSHANKAILNWIELNWERQGHITVESAVLIAACVLQTHTSIITVSVTRLCSPLGLELMVKLRTLLTVFTFILKDEAGDYVKGRNISDECLRCSANHNALYQLANQSRLRLSEGGTL